MKSLSAVMKRTCDGNIISNPREKLMTNLKKKIRNSRHTDKNRLYIRKQVQASLTCYTFRYVLIYQRNKVP